MASRPSACPQSLPRSTPLGWSRPARLGARARAPDLALTARSFAAPRALHRTAEGRDGVGDDCDGIVDDGEWFLWWPAPEGLA